MTPPASKVLVISLDRGLCFHRRRHGRDGGHVEDLRRFHGVSLYTLFSLFLIGTPAVL
jgi:hypothetical protein